MNTSFAAQLRPAVIAMLLLTVITGVLYPLFVTAVAQVVFPWQANGSFVDADGSHARNAKLAGSAQGAKLASSAQGASLAGSAQGASLASSAEGAKVAGSALIGQAFDSPRYFWSRISATSPAPYNAASSSGSNLGPTNPALIDAVKSRIAALRAVDGAETNLIPVDLVTSSASGLDPHISPAAAEWQSARVARARGLSIEAVRALVRQHTERRQLGFFGEARVNVLLLNLDLDRSPDRAPDGSPDRSTKHALSR